MIPLPVLPRVRRIRHLSLVVVLLVALLSGVPIGAGLAVAHADSGQPRLDPGVWPLSPAPTVAIGFNPPDVRWASGHRGVDLAGTVGQSVLAALPGTISFSGSIAGRGVVVVDHGDTRTTYEPVVAGLAVGTPVARGQPIGTLALVGSHCFPAACLHWGWRRGDVYLNPLDLIGPRPVRLLPLSGRPAIGPRAPARLLPFPLPLTPMAW